LQIASKNDDDKRASNCAIQMLIEIEIKSIFR